MMQYVDSKRENQISFKIMEAILIRPSKPRYKDCVKLRLRFEAINRPGERAEALTLHVQPEYPNIIDLVLKLRQVHPDDGIELLAADPKELINALYNKDPAVKVDFTMYRVGKARFPFDGILQYRLVDNVSFDEFIDYIYFKPAVKNKVNKEDESNKQYVLAEEIPSLGLKRRLVEVEDWGDVEDD